MTVAGDGTINYAEFARMMTSEDIMKMKQTLQAAGSAVNAAKIRRQVYTIPLPCIGSHCLA